jgi:hypothetical protein
MPFVYLPKQNQQLRNEYHRRRRTGLNGFINFDDFLDWYNGQKKQCYYCGLLESESQEIAIRGLLTSKRYPQGGMVGQGTARSVWLEIDRLNPSGLYNRENAVLSCYYCNNDKSDIFNGTTYVDFFQNRVGFLRKLLLSHPEV